MRVRRAKNLVVAKQKELTAGVINETKSLLVQFILYLKKRGNKDTTIERKISYLKELVKDGADLLNSESFKNALAKKDWVVEAKTMRWMHTHYS